MKVNINSSCADHIKVLLNGKPITNALEASEEDGYIIAIYYDVRGRSVRADLAEVETGALLYGPLQVIRLTGDVKLCFDLPDLSQDEFVPLEITRKDERQCGI